MSTSTLQVEDAKPTTAVTVATAATVTAADEPGHLRDLMDLVKPRISAMVLVTVALSVFVASAGSPDVFVLLHALIGTALVAASSGAFNQWLEQESDAKMHRTADRPLPAGRMTVAEVVAFGITTLIAGVAYLFFTVGWQPMFWSVLTWIVYVCVYTPMKTWTSWNTTVGAISGALPILIGSSATGTTLDWHIGGMLCVLFFWQFPHFIAIAWIYRQQYSQAGLKMVTTTDPSGRKAGYYSVLGAWLLLASSLIPLFAGLAIPYAILAVALGVYQLLAAQRFNRTLDNASARNLLKASIIYLPLALGLIAAQLVL